MDTAAFFRDYGTQFATTIAVLNTIISLVIGQYFKDSPRSRIALVGASVVLGIIAVVGTFYSQHQIVRSTKEQNEAHIAMKNALGVALKVGESLMAKPRTKNQDDANAYAIEARTWGVETSRIIEDAYGKAEADRFSNTETIFNKSAPPNTQTNFDMGYKIQQLKELILRVDTITMRSDFDPKKYLTMFQLLAAHSTQSGEASAVWQNIILLVAGAFSGGCVTILISRPRVVLSIAKPVVLEVVGEASQEEFRSLRVNVANEARWWTLLAPAVACRGHINFYSHDGHDLFGKPMVARWANSPAPASTVVQSLRGPIRVLDMNKFNRESRLDIYPGDSEPLDIVARLGDDDVCYGFTNESYLYRNDRHPELKLDKGVFLVRVTLSVSGQPRDRYFRLHNDSHRGSLRLEAASKDEQRRIMAASRTS
jgi:hypothetical protein